MCDEITQQTFFLIYISKYKIKYIHTSYLLILKVSPVFAVSPGPHLLSAAVSDLLNQNDDTVL